MRWHETALGTDDGPIQFPTMADARMGASSMGRSPREALADIATSVSSRLVPGTARFVPTTATPVHASGFHGSNVIELCPPRGDYNLFEPRNVPAVGRILSARGEVTLAATRFRNRRARVEATAMRRKPIVQRTPQALLTFGAGGRAIGVNRESAK
jgi:hypothetical protein